MWKFDDLGDLWARVVFVSRGVYLVEVVQEPVGGITGENRSLFVMGRDQAIKTCENILSNFVERRHSRMLDATTQRLSDSVRATR